MPTYTDSHAPTQSRRHTSLAAVLKNGPLADLLVWLHRSKRSAMLRVGMGSDAGLIFFRNGRLLRCEWRGQYGKEALVGILLNRDRSFSLVQRSIPDFEPNLTQPTAELLLQCAMGLERTRQTLHD